MVRNLIGLAVVLVGGAFCVVQAMNIARREPPPPKTAGHPVLFSSSPERWVCSAGPALPTSKDDACRCWDAVGDDKWAQANFC